MVEGVTKGFERNLELVGVGYRASKSGQKLANERYEPKGRRQLIMLMPKRVKYRREHRRCD